MAFDVSKFLALTALIASTGAACSSSEKDDKGSNGGSTGAGTAGKSSAGAPDTSGGGSTAGHSGDEAGAPALGGNGGDAVGGAAEAGGAGGAGGEADTGECLGPLAAGGAGGAGALVEPSLEDLCMDFFTPKCPASIEDFDPTYKVCEGVKERALPAVALKVTECLKALSADDACDGAKVSTCFTSLEGKGCVNPDAATPCASIHANCADVSVDACKKIADLISPDS